MLTSTSARPWEYVDCPPSLTHGFRIAPIPKPVVEPVTSIRRPSRAPVMTMDGPITADGVTAFDGSDAADQPAPVNACTVKVYVVPFVSPSTVHEVVAVRQMRPPGDEITWYVNTGNEPVNVGADHVTEAERSPATAATLVGGFAGIGGGGGGRV